MRKAIIYYKDLLAGILTETDDGDYIFQYEEAYVKNYPRQFLGKGLDLTDKQISGVFKRFVRNRLIAEEWLQHSFYRKT
jgi:serine/threonine-protein kinase HipA